MENAENNLQPSKKRAAGVQLSRDNPGLDDNEDTPEQEAGTFKRASDEVLASRRILKVRRQQPSSTPSAAPASNPFAAISLVAPAAPAVPASASSVATESKEAEQTDKNDKKSEIEADESTVQPTVDEEQPGAIEGNVEPLESKIDKSITENDVKDKNESASEQTTTESAVDEVAESDETGIEARKEGEGEEKGEEKDNSEKTTDNNEKDKVEETTEKNAEASSFSSFQQLSSNQNAFSGLAGTGFSSTSFSFGSISKDGSTSGSLFGLKNDQPSFSFGVSGNGSSSLFGSVGANTGSKTEGSKLPSMQEVPVETGEENEKAVFTADSALFEFIDGSWKERGKGEVKVNVPTTGTGKARLVMRTRGNYRLILNASLFPDMKLTNMDKKGITFACVNSASEGKDGLSTVALKFKDPSIVQEFQAAVMEHKSTAPVTLKTPENSPKASD